MFALLAKSGSLVYTAIKGLDLFVKAANLQAKIMPASSRKTRWIRLDVGGTQFLTTKHSLTQDKKSLFGRLFAHAESLEGEKAVKASWNYKLKAVWYGPYSPEVAVLFASPPKLYDQGLPKGASAMHLLGKTKLPSLAQTAAAAAERAQVNAQLKDIDKAERKLAKERLALEARLADALKSESDVGGESAKKIKIQLKEVDEARKGKMRERDSVNARIRKLDAREDAQLAKSFLQGDDDIQEVFRFVANLKFISQEKDDLFYIDRDPVHFRPVLNYLRYGRLILDAAPGMPQPDLTGVLEEAKFFLVHDLIIEAERLLADRARQGL